jgi:hypothetical protein
MELLAVIGLGALVWFVAHIWKEAFGTKVMKQPTKSGRVRTMFDHGNEGVEWRFTFDFSVPVHFSERHHGGSAFFKLWSAHKTYWETGRYNNEDVRVWLSDAEKVLGRPIDAVIATCARPEEAATTLDTFHRSWVLSSNRKDAGE